jgi:hypothetical protein
MPLAVPVSKALRSSELGSCFDAYSQASGYGRFGGSPGMHEFTDVQWVIVEDPAQHCPI